MGEVLTGQGWGGDWVPEDTRTGEDYVPQDTAGKTGYKYADLLDGADPADDSDTYGHGGQN